ncbi:MAG: hypothetical protein HC896_04125 [Bacteroidales bacterium]|nr:hypothetical protein [Bacteroidales bacterium]
MENYSSDPNLPLMYDCPPGGSCPTIDLMACSPGYKSANLLQASCDGNLTNEQKALAQIAYLKKYGEKEFGTLAENIYNKYKANPTITVEEVWDLFALIDKQYKALKGKYLMAIYGTVAENG